MNLNATSSRYLPGRVLTKISVRSSAKNGHPRSALGPEVIMRHLPGTHRDGVIYWQTGFGTSLLRLPLISAIGALMRRLKTTLLMSGLIAVPGAHSAELPPPARAARYMTTCTPYGGGFYYISGSDTCIAFGGYVRSDYGFNVTGARVPHYSGVAGAQDRSVSQHSTRHRGTFQIDTRTQTSYG